MKNVQQKAINHAIILRMANYSKKRLGQIENLDSLIGTSDNNWLQFNLGKLFDVDPCVIADVRKKITDCFEAVGKHYHILHLSDPSYPDLLKRTAEPPLFLYCRGNLSFFKEKTVAVIGSRGASPEGLRRAKKLARLLTRVGYTVVSGLAKGIDAKGHTGAIEEGGKTIAVIGTPLEKSYPKENRDLQEQIATDHLLVSQFHPGHPVNRACFPTRNYTMSGVSLASVIVEAGETSGTLIQARMCMNQGRHLFLLKSLLDRDDLTWPKKYVNKGAFVISSIEDVPSALARVPEYKGSREEQTLFKYLKYHHLHRYPDLN